MYIPTNKKTVFETLGTTASHSVLVKMLMFPLLTKNIDNVRSSGKKKNSYSFDVEKRHLDFF